MIGFTTTRFLTLGLMVMATTLACGPAAPTSPPTPSPMPTETPTPTATAEPTIAGTPDWELEKVKRDQLSEQLLIEIDVIVANAVPGKRGGREALEANARHYVSLYMASTCVNNMEPSLRDFRLFAGDAIGKRILVNREALREIRSIIGVADSWRRQSLGAAAQHCLQPYLYPESLADSGPAVELYLASQLPLLAPLAKIEFETEVRERAGGWFGETDQEQPYIAWLCGSNC